MSRQKVTQGEASFVKAKELTVGTIIAGSYLGHYVDKYNKRNHRLAQADGSTKIVNGSGQLNKLLEKVPTGSQVELEYRGTQKLTKGEFAGTEAHQFDVYIINGDANAATKTAPAKATGSDKKYPF